MRNLIDVALWRMERITAKNYASDFYYVKLTRKLYDIISFSELGKEQGDDACLNLAVALGHYFEDIVSGIGVWQTFTSKHKELYGKYLPFYDVDEEEYYQDEVNFNDVRLLIWMVILKEPDSILLDPEDPFLEKLTYKIYSVLDDEFEKAPMNLQVAEDLKSADYFDDFNALRNFLIRMVKWNYLFIIFTAERLECLNERMEVSSWGNDLAQWQASYEVDCLLACCEKTGPLSLYLKDWLAALLSFHGMTKESERVAAIEFLNIAPYQLKKYDSENIYLVDVKGEEYVVTRDSFNQLPDSTPRDNETFMGSLVKYDGVWQVNGITSWIKGSGYFNSYKRKVTSKVCSPTLYKKLMIATENHPLVYFKDYQEISDWFDTYAASKKRIFLSSRMKNKHFFALYIGQDGNIDILPDGALKIKDIHNPYYDQTKAEGDAISLIMYAGVAPDNMLHYLIKHDMLPDACIDSLKGVARGKQLVQENMDFLARFLRDSDY